MKDFKIVFTGILIVATTAAFVFGVSFKEKQMRYERVRNAYAEKETLMKSLFNDKGLSFNKIHIVIIVYKKEEELQLWAVNSPGNKYIYINTYDFCASSGLPGPKRALGDMQIPEGFYFIDRFNPESNFHLSLKINYPNKSDKLLGNKNPGGSIFLHGNCITIGCVPLTDDKIKELYICAVEAMNNGEEKIPVYIFPSKLSNENYTALIKEYKDDTAIVLLWKQLKTGYDKWMTEKQTLDYSIDAKGNYVIR
jgi:murein L,D-transpeptidase YafK